MGEEKNAGKVIHEAGYVTLALRASARGCQERLHGSADAIITSPGTRQTHHQWAKRADFITRRARGP
jgi:hypothetical protein